MTEAAGRISKITFVQPTIPSYRLDFFGALAEDFGRAFTVYSSSLDLGVLTEAQPEQSWSRPLGPLKKLFPGAYWQVGSLSIPIAKGDIVVVSGAPRCISNLVLLLWARMRGAKTVWWGQLWSASTRMHRYILRLLLMRLAHGVIFYTADEVEAYRSTRWGGRDRRSIGALNNGIDVEPIKPRRRAYNPEDRGPTIFFIGRLTEKSHFDLLLQTMTEPEVSHCVLHVIGDGPEAVSFKNWAACNGLQERVVWHGPTVDEEQIANVANRAAIFCYPGAVGLSLVHAMAYGLPAVVHDDKRTHMPEIAAFRHGETGLSFAKGDKRSLALTLADLLESPSRLKHMSKESRISADSVYNTRSMAGRFKSFLNEFLQDSGAAN